LCYYSSPAARVVMRSSFPTEERPEGGFAGGYEASRVTSRRTKVLPGVDRSISASHYSLLPLHKLQRCNGLERAEQGDSMFLFISLRAALSRCQQARERGGRDYQSQSAHARRGNPLSRR
ncbi:MAG: hypothetical protein AAFO91_18025, partial [Bacteroidota bacterium]